MKSQVLHTVLCHISGEAAGEIRNWSLLGTKGLKKENTYFAPPPQTHLAKGRLDWEEIIAYYLATLSFTINANVAGFAAVLLSGLGWGGVCRTMCERGSFLGNLQTIRALELLHKFENIAGVQLYLHDKYHKVLIQYGRYGPESASRIGTCNLVPRLFSLPGGGGGGEGKRAWKRG